KRERPSPETYPLLTFLDQAGRFYLGRCTWLHGRCTRVARPPSFQPRRQNRQTYFSMMVASFGSTGSPPTSKRMVETVQKVSQPAAQGPRVRGRDAARWRRRTDA